MKSSLVQSFQIVAQNNILKADFMGEFSIRSLALKKGI